jgi:transposase
MSTEALKQVMNSQKSVKDFRDYQILYLVDIHKDKNAKDISSMPGLTSSRIYRTIEKYNIHGVLWKEGNPWGGRREARCIMSLEEEKIFLNGIEEEALSGQILTYRHVRLKLEAKLGRNVSDDYVWDLFKRNGWSKKAPGKSHPQSDVAAREEFKKNSLNYWSPNR